MQDFEIIVCDDDSKENLEQVCDSFGDPRIKYYRHPRNIGAVKNSMYAAATAQGYYLKFLHCDDLLLARCLEDCVADLEFNGAEAVLFKAADFTNSNPCEPGSYRMPATGLVANASWSTHKAVMDFHNVTPTAMLLTQEAFWRTGGYDVSLDIIWDWEFYVRFLEEGGRMVFVDRIRAIRRTHGGNLIRTGALTGQVLSDVLAWRRRTGRGRRCDYQNLVFDQLRQCQLAGTSIRPVLRAIIQNGYFWETVGLLPIQTTARLFKRLTKTTYSTQAAADTTPLLEAEIDELLTTWKARPETISAPSNA